MESTEKKDDGIVADNGSGCCSKHGSCPNCKCRSNKKLNVYDWLQDIPESHDDTDMIEVQFKNTRKGYYRNSNKLKLEKGDIVAVESSPGHDIGEVTLTGRLVLIQMKKNNVRTDNAEIKRVYRKAKPADLEKYEEAKAREHDTMLRARKIADDLKLNMKIGDVEYQGDGNKAIFYYIADDRVDFRQLIKVLAEAFRVRIEMKQIGARQEAGRIGGIGPCGRELCCSGWMTSFVSVATSAARYQDISLNPQKLAGQCAKLKCCLNYEVDAYVEAQKQLPSRDSVLQTKDNEYYHFKTDIHKRQITYSTSRDFAANLVTIDASRVFEIIALNKRGVRVDSLEGSNKPDAPAKEFTDVVGQDSLTRFDKSKKNNKSGKNKGREQNGQRRRGENQDENGERNQSNNQERPRNKEIREPKVNDNRNNDRRENRDRRNDNRDRNRNNGADNRQESTDNRQQPKDKDNRPNRENRDNRPPKEGRENRENRENRNREPRENRGGENRNEKRGENRKNENRQGENRNENRGENRNGENQEGGNRNNNRGENRNGENRAGENRNENGGENRNSKKVDRPRNPESKKENNNVQPDQNNKPTQE